MKFVNRATVAATVLSALALSAVVPPVAAQNDKDKPFKILPPVTGPILTAPVKPGGTMYQILGPLGSAKTLDAFFAALPNWSLAGNTANGLKRAGQPNGERDRDAPNTRVEAHNNREYNVTRQNKSLAETPGDIVSFDPAASIFYPGALLQEAGMRQGLGSLQAIPGLENKRAPLKVVMNIGGQTTITDPDYGNVSTAVGQLRSGLNGKPMATSTDFNYSVAASAEQSAIHLGISAKYLTASAKAVLDTKHRLDQESINGTFVVKAYTISAQPLTAGWRGFFNDKFTLGDARALAKDKVIGLDNQPCYVDSVTYGTRVIFNMTRTLSDDEVRAKVNAKGSIGFASGSVDFAAEQMRRESTTVVRFTTIGGGYGNASNAVRTVGAGEFNNTMAALTQQAPQSTELVPISYTVRALKDRSLAAVQSTTDYTTTIAAPNPVGERLRLKLSFQIRDAGDGVANSNVETWATVRVNNNPVGGQPRDKAVTLEKNQTLDLGEIPLDVFYNNTNTKLQVRLYDRDGGSQDDQLGVWSFDFRPNERVGMDSWMQVGYDEKNKVKSRMYLVVERAGYL